MPTDRNTYTLKEALAALPDGDEIHTFRSTRIALIGADWKRKEILALLRKADRIERTGPQASAMGHGMAVFTDGSPLFIATKREA